MHYGSYILSLRKNNNMKKLLIFAVAAMRQRNRRVVSYLKASKTYDAGDYVSALHELHPLAEHGNARAQVKIGSMYATGTGVPKNRTEAERWYRLDLSSRVQLAKRNTHVL